MQADAEDLFHLTARHPPSPISDLTPYLSPRLSQIENWKKNHIELAKSSRFPFTLGTPGADIILTHPGSVSTPTLGFVLRALLLAPVRRESRLLNFRLKPNLPFHSRVWNAFVLWRFALVCVCVVVILRFG